MSSSSVISSATRTTSKKSPPAPVSLVSSPPKAPAAAFGTYRSRQGSFGSDDSSVESGKTSVIETLPVKTLLPVPNVVLSDPITPVKPRPIPNSFLSPFGSPGFVPGTIMAPSFSFPGSESGEGIGTLERPWVTMVDLNHPERTRDGFDVVCVQGIRSGNFLRSAVHIRKMIEVSDSEEWKATIPQNLGPSLSQYDGRCVLIMGPSRPYWFKSNEHYHRTKFCQITANAHAAAQLGIERDETKRRSLTYWLLVFPENVTLNNSTFSGDLTEVDMEEVPMKEDDDGVVICSLAVYWVVALEGGVRIDEKKKKSAGKKKFNF